jgi:DNA-binding Lrp family transcriptional regulator
MAQKEEISFQPDASDLKLLELLQENAKTGVKELAAQLNLTYTPTYERIRKLEQHGYITGYHAHIDRNKLGKKLTEEHKQAISLGVSNFWSKG